jgi:hypothetical protein
MPIVVDPITGGSWYYSDRAGVATVIDAATIATTWDMDDANGEMPA